jgi:anti-sigma factor RsiW
MRQPDERRDHISEELLDEYALGRLPDADAAPVEVHLLLCSFCQDRLQLTDEFIAALRLAADGRKRRTSKPK